MATTTKLNPNTLYQRGAAPDVLPSQTQMDAVETTANGAVQAQGGDASAILVTTAGTTRPRALQDRFADIRNARDHGVMGDGVTDDTHAIALLFTAGGRVYFPAGDYLIAPAGDSAGGVWWAPTNSLWVECDPGARFFTAAPGLDHDMFRLEINPAAVPAEKVDFIWHGGVIDQRAQKNSTSYPYPTEYPAANPGTSATCDGISIRGSYTSPSGEVMGALGRVVIKPDAMISGDHWITAGGDSAIYAGEGADFTDIESVFRGSRDTAVYVSRDDGCNVGDNCRVAGQMINCVYGVSFKRGWRGADIGRLKIINAVIGVQLIAIGGTDAQVVGVTVSGGLFINCHYAIRLEYATGVTVSGNTILQTGATDDNGDAFTTLGTPIPILLQGATAVSVRDNQILGLNPLYAKDGSGTIGAITGVILTDYTSTSPVIDQPTTYSIVRDNYVTGLHSGVQELYHGDYNVLGPNSIVDCTLTVFPHVGAHTVETRRSTVDNVEQHMEGLQVGDGSAATPALRRTAAPNNGVFFDGSGVYVGINGSLRFSFTNTVASSTVLFNAGLGSAAAPAYAFNADPGTGMYRAATNTLGFSAGGTEALEISPEAVTLKLPVAAQAYALAALPAAAGLTAGTLAFVSDGRDTGEAAGTGTGCLAVVKGGAWCAIWSGVAVTA